MNLKALNQAIVAKDAIKRLANILSKYEDTVAYNDETLALTTIIRKNMKNIQKQLKLK